ncbi:hypothetical protein PHYSODRAFT_472900, partial [Phytophthora sojae]
AGHHVFDCPFLGKRPPAEDRSSTQAQKRVKMSGGKSTKAAEKSNYANESDDSAYVILQMKMPVADKAHYNWYLDPGASSHISNQLTDFMEFTPLSARIRVGGKNSLSVEGIGTVVKELETTGGRCSLTLRGVRYAPELQCSLYSVRPISA